MNIQDFRDKVNSWNSDLEDTKAKTSDMQLTEWNLEFTPQTPIENIGSLPVSALFGDDVVTVNSAPYDAPMLDHARSQLAGRLGIPSRWIQDPEKCPVELREKVFNWKFFNEEEKELFLRLKGGNLRAVLSDKYTQYDHADLFGAVYNALEMNDMLSGVEICKSHVGDTMAAYLVWQGTNFNGNGNDRPMGDGGGSGGLKPAVYISNSEIGTGSSRIHGGLFRSFCTNGMILGWKAETAFQIIHRFKNRNQVALLANEAIAEALKLSEVAANKFMNAQHQFITPTSLKSITGKWAKKYGLTVGQNESWLEAITADTNRNHGRVSYADVINQATYFCHRTEDSELVETFERMAGEMVYAEVPREVLLEE